MRSSAWGVGVVLLGAMGCAHDAGLDAGRSGAPSTDLELLSQSQLRATIVGSIISDPPRSGPGITVSVRYSQSYRRDGTVVQWLENAQTIGTYRFSGNSVCSTISGQTRCWSLLREGPNYWRRYNDHPHQLAPARIDPGE